MTAYELAEKMHKAVNNNEKHLTLDIEAMLMLRQQADRIAELEKLIEIFDAELMKSRISNSLMKTDRDRLAKEISSKPVAWRSHYPSGWEYKDGNPPFELGKNDELLYTHPVKKLSDEEIINIFAEHTRIGGTYEVKDIIFPFARAIIKASRGEE